MNLFNEWQFPSMSLNYRMFLITNSLFRVDFLLSFFFLFLISKVKAFAKGASPISVLVTRTNIYTTWTRKESLVSICLHGIKSCLYRMTRFLISRMRIYRAGKESYSHLLLSLFNSFLSRHLSPPPPNRISPVVLLIIPICDSSRSSHSSMYAIEICLFYKY